ncbi:MAG: hypothetical protein CMJ89_08470 [Planctomycetes bacterium]|jgi:hypothetical protein|nr:hypothetical protein [Planctomycetota bacterium]
MSSERTWIIILSITCFFAGLAGGVVFAAGRFPQEELGPFAQYEKRMVDYFDLDEDRQRHLRYILEGFKEEIERLKEHNIHRLEDRLVNEGKKRHDLIGDWVIPENRREEFNRCSLGFPVETSPN